MSKIRFIIAGAGDRGTGYANYIAQHSEAAQVVGVAEPREFHRERLVQDHGISPEYVFKDWQSLAKNEKFADAVIIAVQDSMHADAAVAFARKGYDILLEKPMATSEADCRRIVKEVKENDIIFGVCHVLRYTAYTQKLKSIIDSGAIGEIVNIQHLEPLGYWHMAHSFVRGNWRNEAESAFMLLTKSCHDLDWIRYIIGEKCNSLSSYGSLYHFRRENKPDGASNRCLDCSVETQCAWSAKRIYLERAERGDTAWPVNVITEDTTPQGVLDALKTGPYGRCVYECDNDVVDNQVVSMQFDKNKTATFTMMAFTEMGLRKTRIFGTKGEIYCDSAKIEHYDFLSEKRKIYDTSDFDDSDGHAGGDEGLMRNFIEAVDRQDQSLILSGPDETLESHLMVFGAEKSRRLGQTIKMETAQS